MRGLGCDREEITVTDIVHPRIWMESTARPSILPYIPSLGTPMLSTMVGCGGAAAHASSDSTAPVPHT